MFLRARENTLPNASAAGAVLNEMIPPLLRASWQPADQSLELTQGYRNRVNIRHRRGKTWAALTRADALPDTATWSRFKLVRSSHTFLLAVSDGIGGMGAVQVRSWAQARLIAIFWPLETPMEPD